MELSCLISGIDCFDKYRKTGGFLDKHPYVSGSGALTQCLDYLRKSFPSTFNSDTLKKLSLAPANESYILNILRFLKLIDEQDTRTTLGEEVFTLHADKDFHDAFSKVVRDAYTDLFNLHQEATWSLNDDKLIPFFRQTDKTSEIVGTRQASTFPILSAYSGHETIGASARQPKAQAKQAFSKVPKTISKKTAAPPPPPTDPGDKGNARSKDIGLTVRIEINLPATGDQETYDKIFKSIRENFLNA